MDKNKTQKKEINRLCQLIAENFNSDETIDKFKNLLQENPEMLESLEEAILSLQEEKEILREFETLKRYDLPQVAISQEAFENFVDDVLNKNYQQTPNIVKLGDIDENLAKALDINKVDIYLTRKQLSHFRLERKDKQALTIDEIKNIPKVISLAQEAFIDTEKQNFTLSFKDEYNVEKINLLHFNADKQGNYIVTVKKMDLKHFQRIGYVRVVAGIEPAIHSNEATHSTKSRGITTQKVSPTGVAPAISTNLKEKIAAATSLQASNDTDRETIPHQTLNNTEKQKLNQDDGDIALKSIKDLEVKRQENLRAMQDLLNNFKDDNKNNGPKGPRQ